MRCQAQTLLRLTRPCERATGLCRFPQRRFVQIAATPSSTNPTLNLSTADAASRSTLRPDAQFEVLGSPYSLLSASISASQNLYTRKGSLVGFNGDAESTVSTLSILEPFRRALFGIPFLYQKITSTSPYTALISSKSPVSTFSVIHLDGRLDWMIAQRDALLAWTGHSLNVKPQVNTQMGLAHWGSSRITGRGLICLSGKGQVYQLALKSGEEYVVHPNNVIAYSIMQHAPQPYRFRSSTLRFQVPDATSLLPDTRFFRIVRESKTWRVLAATAFTLRTWTRRTIWGDRLFLRFQGPANILVQSRGARITESLTSRDVNEIADTPAGALQSALTSKTPVASTLPSESSKTPVKLSYATVDKGKVDISKA
ncbi:mitochondrial biogenesis AIM24-domain-containing protein [Delphinella strobiligena]|nr:mitochondrial biogenesis AIM24-domain-containing protein [Delphinella strobiligena]